MTRWCSLVLLVVMLIADSLPAEETWLAVGYGGRRMISTDGQTWDITAEWAQPGGDDGNNLMSAVYAQNKFVVVGGGGAGQTGAGHILVSSDGREWREVYSEKSRINPVTFGNERFVAGGGGWPSGRLLYSLDGEKWEEGAKIASRGFSHFRQGTYGNGVHVLVGNGTMKDDDGENKPIHWAITSPDGQTIRSERSDLPGHGTLVFGAGQFLMLTSHSQADVIASVDGAEWKKSPLPGDVHVDWLAWTGSEFWVGGEKSFRSRDGQTWESLELARPRGQIQWTDGKRAIASGWPGKMSFTSDGKAWIAGNPLTDNGINRVVFAPHRTAEEPK